jgi:hypothetical protein
LATEYRFDFGPDKADGCPKGAGHRTVFFGGVEEMAGDLNVLRETVVVTGGRAGLRLDSPGKTTMVEKPIDV